MVPLNPSIVPMLKTEPFAPDEYGSPRLPQHCSRRAYSDWPESSVAFPCVTDIQALAFQTSGFFINFDICILTDSATVASRASAVLSATAIIAVKTSAFVQPNVFASPNIFNSPSSMDYAPSISKILAPKAHMILISSSPSTMNRRESLCLNGRIFQ
ncbi:hypothetical protein QFZ34_000495 [Phyllobacterium ifriqiyense]|uniref:Uncharacterized protein n=1 Tax=Phyllobacterium ifriqiyense TaxID=314238 RepID=A0ABU0S6L9_9HYPH|nr:hypothetical protein [Phyllobacterium ifriqiyense]